MDNNNDEIGHQVLNIKKTIEGYDREIKDYPQNYNLYSKRSYAHMRLADAYKGLGEIDNTEASLHEALADCVALLQIKPDHYDAHINSGLVKEKLSNIKTKSGDIKSGCKLLKEAIQSHNKAIGIESDIASLYCIRGNVKQSLAYLLRKLDKYTEAEQLFYQGVKDYDQAIKLGDHNAYASRGAAKVLMAMQLKYQSRLKEAQPLIRQAIDDYTVTISYDLDKPKLFYLRAEAKGILADISHYLDRKKDCGNIINDAISDYEKDLEDDPNFVQSFLGIAVLKYIIADREFGCGNYESALKAIKEGKAICNKALALDDEYPCLYYERAYFYFIEAALAEKQGDTSKAFKLLKKSIEDWEKLIDIEPDNVSYKQRLQDVNSALKEISKSGSDSLSAAVERINSDKPFIRH